MYFRLSIALVGLRSATFGEIALRRNVDIPCVSHSRNSQGSLRSPCSAASAG